ncbi:MAG: hypothetical protein ABI543_13175 [Ignavibacteria bacterium]
MDNLNPEIHELTISINRLITEYTKLYPALKAAPKFNDDPKQNQVSDKSFNTAREITGYFELMLGTTKGMLSNMGMMDSGFAKTVQLILQILGSIGGGGGFGGFFSGLLGVIGGLVGGPLGAAAGGGIGSILGRASSAPLNQGLNANTSGSNNVINQVIIKNPVTFTKAFDVEVRTRTLRGGIDL